jgi:hypothetical protein
MAYEVTCGQTAKNTGVNELCQDIGSIVGFAIGPRNLKLDTEAAAKLEANWLALTHADKSGRVYPFPPDVQHEDGSEETIYQDFALGTVYVGEGKMIWNFTIPTSRYKHEALKSHSNRMVSVVFFDQQGRVHGQRSETNEFLFVNMAKFTVEKLKVNNGTEGTTTKVSMQFENPITFQTMPAVVVPTFDVSTLEGLKDVVLAESGAQTTSLLKVSAKIKQSGANVLGLSETVGQDWQILNGSGVAQTPTTITDNEDGTYSFAFGTPLTAGTYAVNLKTPGTMTTKGYESAGAVSITVA